MIQVSSSLSRHETLLDHTQLLHRSLRNLTQTADSAFESQLLSNFSLALNNLVDLCTQHLEEPEGANDDLDMELDMECMDLLETHGDGAGGYVPDIPPSIGALRENFNTNRPLLQRLLEILENETFSGVAGVIDSRPDYFSMLVCIVHASSSLF